MEWSDLIPQASGDHGHDLDMTKPAISSLAMGHGASGNRKTLARWARALGHNRPGAGPGAVILTMASGAGRQGRGPGAALQLPTPSNSTSKIKVALGGMTPPAPRSP